MWFVAHSYTTRLYLNALRPVNIQNMTRQQLIDFFKSPAQLIKSISFFITRIFIQPEVNTVHKVTASNYFGRTFR